MTNPINQINNQSFTKFPYDTKLIEWVNDAYQPALQTLTNPKNKHWWRHNETWFVGVNALPNNTKGQAQKQNKNLPIPLQGNAIDSTKTLPPSLFGQDWDKAQISVCTQGYPQKDSNETQAAHLYRKNRYAAHIDGLLKCGKNNHRYLREQHAFILAIAMNNASQNAAPFVVYEGSHKLVAQFLQDNLAHKPPETWQNIDLTNAYHDIRHKIFDTCQPQTLWLKFGEAFLVHRFALHGTQAWSNDAEADLIDDNRMGRILAFFRPYCTNPTTWLNAD